MQSLANSLYLLVARDFAPPEKRIPNLRQRMEAIPRVIAQAKANLQHPPRVHTETAIEQTQGAINLVREGLAPLLDRAPQMKKDLAPLQEKTAAALEDYKKWLQNDLLPRSDGNFRLGAEKFRKKLRFALASDLSMEEIMKRAQADLQQTQTAIYETALPLYKKYFPNADAATLADKHKVTAAVLDKLAEQHPDDDTVVGYAKKVVTRSDRFRQAAQSGHRSGHTAGRDRDAGIQTRRGHCLLRFARAAGEKRQNIFRRRADAERLVKGAKGIVLSRIQQLHDSRSDRARSDARALSATRARERIPARRHWFARFSRAAPFIEGWAVYCEQMMAEQGYGGPEVKMQQLKMRLRAICQRHSRSKHSRRKHDREGSDGFDDERRLSSRKAKRWRNGNARGSLPRSSPLISSASPSISICAQREQKKLGKDFDLKKYNDQVISYGSPPVKYVRELMGL